uniref:Uncharacterized protein n=2 Tax=Spironucleus salmonicida TaxID=348837 RepID=V6LC27_9EUKA|eukprot:EST42022.1 Hypothetical protein SS50377_18329 [Spironucleus salmonicida]
MNLQKIKILSVIIDQQNDQHMTKAKTFRDIRDRYNNIPVEYIEIVYSQIIVETKCLKWSIIQQKIIIQAVKLFQKQLSDILSSFEERIIQELEVLFDLPWKAIDQLVQLISFDYQTNLAISELKQQYGILYFSDFTKGIMYQMCRQLLQQNE